MSEACSTQWETIKAINILVEEAQGKRILARLRFWGFILKWVLITLEYVKFIELAQNRVRCDTRLETCDRKFLFEI
jgi:hypothetical protein